ncbi:MAG: nitroreductase family protein [Candidatus Hydrogenedentes bacterium]|nr:nitroreductase family protein [Candidatus Hydrogenedentota bacterium]
MELVEKIIAESLFAPSGGNSQPWGFIIVNDRDTVQRLSKSSKQTILDEIGRGPKHYMSMY